MWRRQTRTGKVQTSEKTGNAIGSFCEALESRLLLSTVAAPTGLTAQISGTSVVLNWTDNDPSATGYYVFRSQDNINFNLRATLTGGTVDSFSQPFPLYGKTFYYIVEAFNAAATSGPSISAGVTTPLETPTNLTAQISGTSVDLNWTDNDPTATGYYIYRSQDNINFNLRATLTGGSVDSYSQPFPLYGKTFYYRVEAFNTLTPSAPSASASVTTPLETPTGLTTQISGTSVDLNWTDNDPTATGYYIYRSQDNINFNLRATLTGGSIDSYSQPFPLYGKTFYYEVVAFNTVTTSVASTSASVTTPLETPTNLTAQISGTSIDLNWTDNDPTATGYYVYRSQDGINLNLIATLSGGSVDSFSQSFPATGKFFYYYVKAFNALTTSVNSAPATVTTPIQTPTGLTAQISGTSIDLNWTDNDSSATGYYVYRSQNNVNFNLDATLTGGSIDSYSELFPGYSTTFYYEVEAFNTVSTSAKSTSASVATPIQGPSGLTATLVSGQVQLNWTDHSGSATGEIIQRTIDGGGWVTLTTLAANATGYTDSSVSGGHLYQYQIISASTPNSAPSNTASVATVPSSPDDLVVTPASDTEINLTWNRVGSGETSITIWRSTGGGAYAALITLPAGSNIYTDTSCYPSTTYSYEVTASNAAGSSAPSSPVSGSTMASEAGMLAGTSFTATTASPFTINLTWTDGNSEYGNWLLERSTNGILFSIVAVVSGAGGGASVSYTDTPLSPGTTYYYRVRDTNPADGYSNYTPIVSATTQSRPVNTPVEATGLTATVNSATGTTLTWNDTNSGTASYIIYTAPFNWNGAPSFTEVAQTAVGAYQLQFDDDGRNLLLRGNPRCQRGWRFRLHADDYRSKRQSGHGISKGLYHWAG